MNDIMLIIYLFIACKLISLLECLDLDFGTFSDLLLGVQVFFNLYFTLK